MLTTNPATISPGISVTILKVVPSGVITSVIPGTASFRPGCVTALQTVAKEKTNLTVTVSTNSNDLKTLDTVFSLGVSQHIHKITNLRKFELNWSSKLRDNNERRKHPSHTKLCAFKCLISRPNSKSEVLKSNLWNITSFSKTRLFQTEPFLTMFYSINPSPLLITM